MRFVIPALIAVLGLFITWAVVSGGPDPQPQSSHAVVVPVLQDNTQDDQTEPANDGPISLTGLSVLPTDQLDLRDPNTRYTDAPATLGSTDRGGDYRLEVRFSRYGAGIATIHLADYRVTNEPDAEPYQILSEQGPPAQPDFSQYHYGALTLEIEGQTVEVYATGTWSRRSIQTTEQGQSVEYRAIIINEDGDPVVELRRIWTLEKNSYDLRLNQYLINRSGRELDVRFRQHLACDLTADRASYLGDRRHVVLGHFNPNNDPNRTRTYTDDGFLTRDKVVKGKDVWPNDNHDNGETLAWIALENRYFAVVTHADLPDTVQSTADVPDMLDGFARVIQTQVVPSAEADAKDKRLILIAETEEITLSADPQQLVDLSLGVYAGPRDSELFKQAPYSFMDFQQMIRYSMGGPCAFCTFQWLANLLLWLLKFFASFTLDWGVAIILLVLLVRLMLHPITKKAQVNMMVLGKQMQAMQPELEKLKKKYADEPQRMQQEQIRLWREHGVNPFSMLGCLPMFLQTPIWIALYAMLYYAIELRQEHAFYGIFQMLGNWQFLGDLARPDRFYVFSEDPIIFKLLLIQFDFSSFNILPILMAGVFYINSRLTTPPAMNDQARQQQKIMRVMLFIFPVFLYAAPAGLTLYIAASTTAGIIDSYLVRRHVKAMENRGELDPTHENFRGRKEKAPPKPGSFRDRLRQRMDEAQKMAEEMQKAQQQQKGNKGRGGKGPRGRR